MRRWRNQLVLAMLVLVALTCAAWASEIVRNRNHSFDGDYMALVENRTTKEKEDNVPAVLEGSYVTFKFKGVKHVLKFVEMMNKRFCFEISERDPETNELYVVQLKQ